MPVPMSPFPTAAPPSSARMRLPPRGRLLIADCVSNADPTDHGVATWRGRYPFAKGPLVGYSYSVASALVNMPELDEDEKYALVGRKRMPRREVQRGAPFLECDHRTGTA